MNISATRGAITPTAARLSVTFLSVLIRWSATAHRLCGLHEESLETHCTFATRHGLRTDPGNDPGLSCAFASGGSAQAVRLPDPRRILSPFNLSFLSSPEKNPTPFRGSSFPDFTEEHSRKPKLVFSPKTKDSLGSILRKNKVWRTFVGTPDMN